MNKYISTSKVFKILPYLILILVLVVSSCGIKHSINKHCNVENNSSKTQKATPSCNFVQLANNQKDYLVSVKKVKFHSTNSSLSSTEFSVDQISTSFSKEASIPLYILYKRLRSDLI